MVKEVGVKQQTEAAASNEITCYKAPYLGRHHPEVERVVNEPVVWQQAQVDAEGEDRGNRSQSPGEQAWLAWL